jgi:AcrR family transcriptional regulator
MPAEATGKRRDERRAIPAELIAASRKKFLYFGVHRTTMADISREIGMPRQTLYEYVSSRDDLVEAVLIHRIHEIADELKELNGKSFSNALVATAVTAIRRARSDKELMTLVSTAPKDLVQRIIVGRCEEIHDIVRHLFDPILDRGEKAGELRSDKTRDEIVDWFRIVFLALITQVDIDRDVEHSIVADFLLRSVMPSAAPSRKTASVKRRR